jgi:hypothetical protein
MKRPIFTFDTTHHALWAEELAAEAGIPHAVVAPPAAARARCSIAIETLEADVAVLREILTHAAVSFRLFDAPG